MMALSFRIFGTVDTNPTVDEILESLEDSDFEITVESDDDDEENWIELMIYDGELAEPLNLYRIDEPDSLEHEVGQLISALTQNGPGDELHEILHVLENAVVVYSVEVPDALEDEDNALLLGALLAQLLTQKVDGIYSVDAEGFFNDTGDLIYELAYED